MKKNLFIAAMGLLVMAGCSSDDEIGSLIQENKDNANAITFDTYVGKVTKAAVDGATLPSSTKYGVFAFYLEQGAWAEAAAPSANFMFNQEVTDQGTYTPVKYWPTTGSVSFIAYYPYGSATFLESDKTTAYSKTSTGLPVAKFINTDATVDFMYTEVIKDKNSSIENKTVPFVFKHALSKITLQIKEDANLDKDTKIKITSSKLTGIFSEATLPIGTTSATWTSPITAKEYTAPSDGVYLLIPQPLQSQTVEIQYTVTTGTDGDNNYFSFSDKKEVLLLTEKVPSWVMGSAYTYNITVSLDAVRLSATVDPVWSNADPQPDNI